jgi:hypothetical protein
MKIYVWYPRQRKAADALVVVTDDLWNPGNENFQALFKSIKNNLQQKEQ